jgi:hypothetical protein
MRIHILSSNKTKQRSKEGLQVKNSFIVRYFVDKEYGEGFVQAFKFQENLMFVLLLEKEVNLNTKPFWVPAMCCECRKIFDINFTEEIMKRDNVSLKDLEVIEDFGWRFEKEIKRRDRR